MAAYYNEIDKQKAAWLRELISRGCIAPGDVDERSIHDVRSSDLRGYKQCHFFAGVGIWSYALRLAGWEDDRPVWTGSCPCPSFSTAGKGSGFDDPRHLWPIWYPIIRESGPPVIFGEQVDDAVGYGWLDLVSTDLEAAENAVAAAVLGACSVGAPEIRQRLYWVAESLHAERRAKHGPRTNGRHRQERGRKEACGFPGACGEVKQLGISESQGLQDGIGALCQSGADKGGPARSEQAGSVGKLADTTRGGCGEFGDAGCARSLGHTDRSSEAGGLADADGRQSSDRPVQRGGQHGLLPQDGEYGQLDDQGRPGPVNGFWRDADWLFCTDGFWRPVEAGAFPLAHGAPARMGRLRGYGDGIVAQVAAEFIKAYMETRVENE